MPISLTGDGGSADIDFPMWSDPNSSKVWARENAYTNLSLKLKYGADHLLDTEKYNKDEMPSDVVRILAVGDSYTYGIGAVDSSISWPERLEVALNKNAGSKRFAVVPLAFPGASTIAESEWLSDSFLEEFDPQLIVVGHVMNDLIPSGKEQAFCPGSSLGCNVISMVNYEEYLTCLDGKGSLAAELLQRRLSFIFPRLASSMLTRYCDNLAVLAEDGAGIPDSALESVFYPYFLRALDRFAEINQRYPVLSTFLHSPSSDVQLFKKFEPELIERGIAVASMLSTKEMLNIFPLEQLRVNPADDHPGSVLTNAYVADMLGAISEKFPDLLVKPKESQIDHMGLLGGSLVTHVLPVHAKVQELSEGATVVSVGAPESAVYEALTRFKEYTVQEAPCAVVGAPHMRLSLDPYLPAGTKLEVSGSDVEYDLYVTGFDKEGLATVRLVGLVDPGMARTFMLGRGEHGLIFKPTDGVPCSGDLQVYSPRMKVEVRLVARS